MAKELTRDEAVSGTMKSLRRIMKSFQDYSQRVLSHFGVTGPQLWVLKTLAQDGDLALGHLSKRMSVNPSTITGVVDRLEKKGYVIRIRNQKDRRLVKVQLTPAGMELVKRAPDPMQGKLIYGLKRLKKDELYSIYKAVAKLVEIMEAHNVKVTFLFDQEE